MRRLCRFAILACMFALVYPSLAHALVNYAVVPSKLEINAVKGGETTQSIQIYNKQDSPLDIKAYVMDYKINEDNGFVFSAPGSEAYSAAQWIKLEKSNFTIPPKGNDIVPFKLKTPATAEVGGHYAVIFLESGQKVAGKGILKGRIGSLILATVPGEVTRVGNIESFKIINPRHSRNVKARLVIANDGNVHITTRADVRFSDSTGKTAGKADYGEFTILPKTKRALTVDWRDAPAWGKFKAVATMSYGPDLNTFTTSKRAEAVFLIIPWLFIAAVLGGLFILYMIKRLRKKRRFPDSPESIVLESTPVRTSA